MDVVVRIPNRDGKRLGRLARADRRIMGEQAAFLLLWALEAVERGEGPTCWSPTRTQGPHQDGGASEMSVA